MISGRVVKFTKERGFGFIKPDDGGQDVFLHIAELNQPGDAKKLRVGQVVTFSREDGDRGPKAMDVSIGRNGVEDDGMSDVLTTVELHGEIDGVVDNAMRRAKLQIKEDLAVLAQGHGWVDG